jgi:hypothetical protein
VPTLTSHHDHKQQPTPPPATPPKLTPAWRRGLLVLLADHWAPSSRGVRESNATSELVDGEPIPNAWGELCVYSQTLTGLRDHGYARNRPGSGGRYELTDAGLELALAVAEQEQAPL